MHFLQPHVPENGIGKDEGNKMLDKDEILREF